MKLPIMNSIYLKHHKLLHCSCQLQFSVGDRRGPPVRGSLQMKKTKLNKFLKNMFFGKNFSFLRFTIGNQREIRAGICNYIFVEKFFLNKLMKTIEYNIIMKHHYDSIIYNVMVNINEGIEISYGPIGYFCTKCHSIKS